MAQQSNASFGDLGVLRERTNLRDSARESVIAFDRYLLGEEILMSLFFDRITSGPQTLPRRLLVYGIAGVGKSTFASGAPAPIFIDCEQGLANLDCDRFAPTNYEDVVEFLRELYSEKHDFKTVVVDSVDWLEQLIWDRVCEDNGKKRGEIESFGYGRGYSLALKRWLELLSGLDALRKDRGLAVVFVAHARIERFDAPDSESYDRYSPRLQKLALPRLIEWCDEVFFATYEVFFRKTTEGRKERSIPMGSGSRALLTSGSPSHLAKNRLNAPESIPLEWSAYEQLYKSEED